MSNKLATLGLTVGMALSGAPKAQAQINQNSANTSENLMEVVSQEKPEKQENTILFEDAKTLQENQELFEKILNDEKIQQLIDEYGEDEVKKVIIEIITHKDTQKVIEKALGDDDIQEAIKEGDREKVEKRIQKIAQGVYKTLDWTDIVSIAIGLTLGELAFQGIKNRKEQREKTKRCQKLIERGQNLIDELKMEEWKEYVNSSVNGPYDGQDVSNVLELLEIIERGASRETVQKIFNNQGHYSGSYNSVRSRVVEFSKKGEEADKNLDK